MALATPERYVNHPPLVVYASALAQVTWGDYDFSLRFVSAFATLVSLSGFAVLFRRLLGRGRGLLALALYTFTPMILYFGRMPNYEPLALALLSVFLARWVAWLRSHDTRSAARDGVTLIVLAGCAIWTAWASFFFVAVCGVVSIFYQNGHRRGWGVVLFVSAPLWVLSVIGFFWLQYPDTITQLIAIFRSRALDMQDYIIKVDLTLGEFVGMTLVHVIATATVALLVCALIGLYLSRSEPDRLTWWVAWALLLAGLSYISVFRNVSYLHNYYKIFLLPAMAIFATYTVTRVFAARRKQRWLHYGLIVLFLSSSITAVIFMLPWYDVGDGGDIRALGYRIRAQTNPAAPIVTNMPYTIATEYYAFRVFQWNIPLDAARAANVPAGSQPTVYCQWADSALHPEGVGAIVDKACIISANP